QRGDVFRQALIEFLEHPFFRVRSADWMAFLIEIVLEARKQLIAVEPELEQPFVEVEEITVLVSLEQRPQLRSEEFLRLERNDLGLRLMPVAHDFEGVVFEAKKILMFPSIQFNLEFQWAAVA